MTVVGLNPATPVSSPRRRTLLPRNPTPWSSPEIPTLPPQVQRLLQQIGGSSYRTYQPFQVVQPLITPQPIVSFIDSSEPSTSAEKSYISTSHYHENSHSSHSGHPQVNFPFPTPTFDNSATNGTLASSNPVQGVRLSPLPLTHLCRNRLVSHFGLRKLRRILLSMRAPKCVAKFLSTVSAKECVVRSSAPLLDVFAEPFFHRAVTWRVECCLDGQPYLATYAHTDTSALVQCEWMTSADVDEELDAASSAWLYCNHPHVMRVWGVVVDTCTGNNFYLLDTPIATLDQILTRLHQHAVHLPEPLVWALLGAVASALLHARRCGLPYAPLQLSNVFLLCSAVVIENALTRKKQFTECSCCSSSRGCCAESCFVQNVGRIIYALCTCGTRSLPGHVEGTRTHYTAVMQDLRRQYSDALLTLLARTLKVGARGSGPPAAPPRWEGNHNGRRVFADVNTPTFPRVKKTDDNSEVFESFEGKSVNGSSSPSEHNLYSSTDCVASRPSSSSTFLSNMLATPASSSPSSSSSAPFQSPFVSSSDYRSPNTEASLSTVTDVGVGISNMSPETSKVKLENSSSNTRHDLSGLTGASHSQSSVSRAIEPLTALSFSQHHFTMVNSANHSASKDILSKTSRKLERRPSPRDSSTRPKGDNDQKVHYEKRRRRTHQRKRLLLPCDISKENISPASCEDQHDVGNTTTTKGDNFTPSHDNRIAATGLEEIFISSFDDCTQTNSHEDGRRDDLRLPFLDVSRSHAAPLRNGSYSVHSNATSTNVPSAHADFSSISLEAIVALAEAEVRSACCGSGRTLEEALRRSPRELVELATSQSS